MAADVIGKFGVVDGWDCQDVVGVVIVVSEFREQLGESIVLGCCVRAIFGVARVHDGNLYDSTTSIPLIFVHVHGHCGHR